MKVKLFLLFILFSLQINAQEKTKMEFSRRPQPDPAIRNLKVGDRVPDILISKIIRNDKSNATISDFKNQLLILDFWDTFCGNCIEALPKLDSMQQKFGDKIKIMPISYQSEEVMRAFFKNNKFIGNIKLPCVVEDKVLGSHFQYKLISHVVWIYKGVVTAITWTDYVTTKNIQAILDGNKVNWPVKNDMVSFDPRQPIFVQNEADQYYTKSNFLQYSGITGQREGIDYKKGLVYDTIGNMYRTSFYNYSIVSTFNYITFKINPRNFILSPGRLILEVKDKSKYVYDRNYGFRTDWAREHQICYEFMTAKQMPEKERLQYVYSDLQHILNVNVKWEKRPVKCFVIVKTKDKINIDSLNKVRKGSRISISFIPTYYLDLEEKYLPGIDETGIKKGIVIEPFNDITGLRKQLQLYGCDIIEAEREIDVMVITENDWKNPS